MNRGLYWYINGGIKGCMYGFMYCMYLRMCDCMPGCMSGCIVICMVVCMVVYTNFCMAVYSFMVIWLYVCAYMYCSATENRYMVQ